MSVTTNKNYPVFSADENTNNFISFRLAIAGTTDSAISMIDADIAKLEENYNELGTLAKKDSLAWSEINDKPSTFTPASHTHSDYVTANYVDARIEAAIAAIPVYDGTVTEV